MLPPLSLAAGRRDGAAHRLDRIVIGVDFTEPSLAVVGWVRRHLAPGAELVLLHVARMPASPNAFRTGPPGRHDRLGARDGAPAEATRGLRGALRGLASLIGGTRVSVDVRVGDPAEELAVYADRVGADLIVVGASASYHVAPRSLTATTERLLRRAKRPVLIARNVRSASPATVLAAVADDADTTAVLGAARLIAGACEARVAELRLAELRGAAGRRDAADREVPAPPTLPAGRIQRWLHATDTPSARSAATVAAAEAARAVLAAARQLAADIIVVGTATRPGPASGAEGMGGDGAVEDGDDAARALARAANCPVLIVPQAAAAHPSSHPPGQRTH